MITIVVPDWILLMLAVMWLIQIVLQWILWKETRKTTKSRDVLIDTLIELTLAEEKV